MAFENVDVNKNITKKTTRTKRQKNKTLSNSKKEESMFITCIC
jgi:hypothetical protein